MDRETLRELARSLVLKNRITVKPGNITVTSDGGRFDNTVIKKIDLERVGPDYVGKRLSRYVTSDGKLKFPVMVRTEQWKRRSIEDIADYIIEMSKNHEKWFTNHDLESELEGTPFMIYATIKVKKLPDKVYYSIRDHRYTDAEKQRLSEIGLHGIEIPYFSEVANNYYTSISEAIEGAKSPQDLSEKLTEIVRRYDDRYVEFLECLDDEDFGGWVYRNIIAATLHSSPFWPTDYEYEDPLNPGEWIKIDRR